MDVTLTCPRDGGPLTRHVAAPAELFQCPACRGIWLSRMDLQSVLGRRVPQWHLPMDEVDSPPVYGHLPVEHCPCAEASPMRPIVRHGVVIDVCLACEAIWLDGGELDELFAKSKAERGALSTILDGVTLAEFLAELGELLAELFLPRVDPDLWG